MSSPYLILPRGYLYRLGEDGHVSGSSGDTVIVQNDSVDLLSRAAGAHGIIVMADSVAGAAAAAGLVLDGDSSPARPGVDYSSMLVRELRDLCRERGIEGYSDMRKAELVAVLSGE